MNLDTMADLSLKERNRALVTWLNDLTTVYEKCAAQRDALLAACEADLSAFERICEIVQEIRSGDTNAQNALDTIFDLASLPAARAAIRQATPEARDA